jgi:hypothetical protein
MNVAPENEGQMLAWWECAPNPASRTDAVCVKSFSFGHDVTFRINTQGTSKCGIGMPSLFPASQAAQAKTTIKVGQE